MRNRTNKFDTEKLRRRMEQVSVTAKRRLAAIRLIGFLVIAAGYLWPDTPMIPVKGAVMQDWDAAKFWTLDDGGVVRKGIHVAGLPGVDVFAATSGVVLWADERELFVLGPHWHIHSYKNLATTSLRVGNVVERGQPIASLSRDDTGNAELYYSVMTIVPYVWRVTAEQDGWQKIFYLDPTEYLVGDILSQPPPRPHDKPYVN